MCVCGGGEGVGDFHWSVLFGALLGLPEWQQGGERGQENWETRDTCHTISGLHWTKSQNLPRSRVGSFCVPCLSLAFLLRQ